jgi:hypothetical protein
METLVKVGNCINITCDCYSYPKRQVSHKLFHPDLNSRLLLRLASPHVVATVKDSYQRLFANAALTSGAFDFVDVNRGSASPNLRITLRNGGKRIHYEP